MWARLIVVVGIARVAGYAVLGQSSHRLIALKMDNDSKSGSCVDYRETDQELKVGEQMSVPIYCSE
jgi:hypothetical protein